VSTIFIQNNGNTRSKTSPYPEHELAKDSYVILQDNMVFFNTVDDFFV
jgi:hypothetical protein